MTPSISEEKPHKANSPAPSLPPSNTLIHSDSHYPTATLQNHNSERKVIPSALPPEKVSQKSTHFLQLPNTTSKDWSKSTSIKRKDPHSDQADKLQSKKHLFHMSAIILMYPFELFSPDLELIADKSSTNLHQVSKLAEKITRHLKQAF